MVFLSILFMIQKEHYLEIAQKYGHCASWAIWADAGDKPKSNIGNIRIFDLEYNPNILEYLNPNVIMAGLNISRGGIEKVFGNFHDSRPEAQDYKIRFAFNNSKYSGAYMTDIIKDFDELISGNVISYLNKNRLFEENNIAFFQQELIDLKTTNPLLIAFGNHSFNLLDKHFKNKFRIIRIPHYSNYISKENYKYKVEKIFSNEGL